MNDQAHWESIYRTKRPDEVSWFQREATSSLALIRRTAPLPGAAIIDVGGGASTLVDGLLSAGYRNLTVLDLSAAALEAARDRLGAAAATVTWRASDVLAADLPSQAFDLWHDRAAFHFLTDAFDRARYADQVRRAVKPGGHVLIATFAEDGPTRCSGLPAVRYAPSALRDELGDGFELLEAVREEHVTPGGSRQAFVYCLLRVAPESSRTSM